MFRRISVSKRVVVRENCKMSSLARNIVLGCQKSRDGEMKGAYSTYEKYIRNCGKKLEENTTLRRSKCRYTTTVKETV